MNKSCIDALWEKLFAADGVVIGAGAGLSTAAGYTYGGKRFTDNFADFIAKYGFSDMYSGGFYPFDTPEEQWAYWSRYIFINRFNTPGIIKYPFLRMTAQNKNAFYACINLGEAFVPADISSRALAINDDIYRVLREISA